MNDRQRRVLVAVRPVVLQGALSALLRAADLGEVVEFDGRPAADDDAPFDVAVVTGDVPREVRSTVVIVLPDTESGTGPATVITPQGTVEVDVQTHRQVLELVDEQFPPHAPLARWVSAAPSADFVAQRADGAIAGRGDAVG